MTTLAPASGELLLSVISQDQRTQRLLARALEASLEECGIAARVLEEGPELGKLVFVDGNHRELQALLDSLDRRGRAVFLIIDEEDPVPEALLNGAVNDVLVHPFRLAEVASKVLYYRQIVMWEEVNHLSTSMSELLARLKDDLQLAERIQKSKLPVRFPDVRGFKIAHRYLAGLKSGGDHFDIAESRDQAQVALVMTDSSSYGLSSAVLTVLMRATLKLSTEQARSCLETVKRIHEELLLVLGEKDHLSLFFGSLSRKDYRLSFVNLGTCMGFYAPLGQEFRPLGSQGTAISRAVRQIPSELGEVTLEPQSRLVLVSDGFIDATGGPEGTARLLNEFRKKEAADTLNEFVFRVKSELKGEEDMPAQDSTIVTLEMESNVLRLARG